LIVAPQQKRASQQRQKRQQTEFSRVSPSIPKSQNRRRREAAPLISADSVDGTIPIALEFPNPDLLFEPARHAHQTPLGGIPKNERFDFPVWRRLIVCAHKQFHAASEV
jgi:hypothetical protein